MHYNMIVKKEEVINMITKLQSKRTGEVADILKVLRGKYKIRKSDGTEKTLSEATVKRWWKEIEVDEPEKKESKPKEVPHEIVKRSEYKEPAVHPMTVKKQQAAEKRQPLLDTILHYAYKEDLTAEKKKIYVGLYYGDRRVAEMRATRKGIRLAVHPKTVENLKDGDLQKVTVQPKSYRVYFNVIYFIESTDDIEFAKKLIQLSKAKVLRTYKGESQCTKL